jgi:hypothetical protein
MQTEPLSCTPSDVRRWPRDIPYMVPPLQDRRGMTSMCDGPSAAHSPHSGTQRQSWHVTAQTALHNPSCNSDDRVEGLSLSAHLWEDHGSWLEKDRGAAAVVQRVSRLIWSVIGWWCIASASTAVSRESIQHLQAVAAQAAAWSWGRSHASSSMTRRTSKT